MYDLGNRIKITGVNKASVICQVATVKLRLVGEKQMLATHFAIKDHNENIF